MAKKVLIISTYPVVDAQHGGQKRVEALIKSYRRHGFEVRSTAIFRKDFYPDWGEYDIPLEKPSEQPDPISMYTTDIWAGKMLLEDSNAQSAMRQQLTEFNPDIIQIEQMFPYYGLESLLEATGWNGKLVYSSHNLEYELKESIIANVNAPSADIKAVIQDIKNKEKELVKNADMVIACTEHDVGVYKEWGAQNIVLAQNGIHARAGNHSHAEGWRTKYRERGVEKIILYIGSAHPPNLLGYEKMVGYGLGFLPADTRLLFVGGVADIVRQALESQPNYIRVAFGLRAEFIGRVSEDDIAALLTIADTIILPITEGGGSNLKTAEAILADAKVVATDYALRSYESYMNLPNLYVANNKSDFCGAIRQAIAADKRERTSEEQSLASKVKWESVLNEAAIKIGEL